MDHRRGGRRLFVFVSSALIFCVEVFLVVLFFVVLYFCFVVFWCFNFVLCVCWNVLNVVMLCDFCLLLFVFCFVLSVCFENIVFTAILVFFGFSVGSQSFIVIFLVSSCL